MSYTSNHLSTMLRNACLVALIVGTGACLLWVNSLQGTIKLRDETIGTLHTVNTELTTSNKSLRESLVDEREATKREADRNLVLEQKLKDKLGNYNNATKDDKCANTVAPDGVIDSVQ